MKEIEKYKSFWAELIEWKQSLDLPPHQHLEMHDQVCRPIMSSAVEAFVYGLNPESMVAAHCADILTAFKGKHSIDLSQESVRGYEPLWNADYKERGSIVAVVRPEDFDAGILTKVRRVRFLTNPGVSNTPSAIKFSRGKAKDGLLAFCFSYHRCRDMQVYGPFPVLEKLYASSTFDTLGVGSSAQTDIEDTDSSLDSAPQVVIQPKPVSPDRPKLRVRR